MDYVDTSEQRLDTASKLGANAILRTAGRRGWWQLAGKFSNYPIAFDGCDEGDGLEFAIRALSNAGVCTSATPYFRNKTALPLRRIYSRSLRFETGLVDARTRIPDIMNLGTKCAFDPSIVTTRLAGWQDAPQALLDEGPTVVVTRPRLTRTNYSDSL